MTRVGWVFLAIVAVLAVGFVSVTRFGSEGGGGPVAASGTPSTVAGGGYGGGLLAVPVAGIPRGAITDTWGQARSEGRVHHGTDIMAAGGAPVVAAAPGWIEKLFQSRLGGTTIYERSPDRRWTYYYAHLSGYAPGLHEGQVVKAGDQIGYVGDTGDAGPGNYHLHFGLTRTTPDQHWYEGEDINAYPYLAGTAPAR